MNYEVQINGIYGIQEFKYLNEQYENIAICLDVNGKTFERELKLPSSVINAAAIYNKIINKTFILISLAMKNLQNQDIKNWLYAHELGHIRNHNLFINLENNVVNNYTVNLRILDKEIQADKYAYEKYGKIISIQSLEAMMNSKLSYSSEETIAELLQRINIIKNYNEV